MSNSDDLIRTLFIGTRVYASTMMPPNSIMVSSDIYNAMKGWVDQRDMFQATELLAMINLAMTGEIPKWLDEIMATCPPRRHSHKQSPNE